jgi:hypothetical protein
MMRDGSILELRVIGGGDITGARVGTITALERIGNGFGAFGVGEEVFLKEIVVLDEFLEGFGLLVKKTKLTILLIDVLKIHGDGWEGTLGWGLSVWLMNVPDRDEDGDRVLRTVHHNGEQLLLYPQILLTCRLL